MQLAVLASLALLCSSVLAHPPRRRQADVVGNLLGTVDTILDGVLVQRQQDDGLNGLLDGVDGLVGGVLDGVL
ncbi:uncharacterized protein EDB91DRAFT_1251373 [Suillus paluster]|uniref:uncharacterized protein n=1 Tax=Suillus paluster TaxID=48578 RepID=UPI001B8707DB|nr:uncharacterized protein EDB91DRAFT_1251373 [Suillus paluster]KAG1733368.1 hypothetical protein EDB91DRAFT_1251373 [Suillus paluster]